MRTEAKKKSLDAVKRLEGLTGKLRKLVENDAYCTEILQLALAMQGHIKHIQGAVLESHLHTCAGKKLNSEKDKDAFIDEVISVIGLSKR
ncbi:metal-sensing transcriptional repressor [Candidatus Peregrinibacteria bacterium]|nr:metal-sensing transcriptional repressor [Candidatus Peregrinibacteria bacterium]